MIEELRLTEDRRHVTYVGAGSASLKGKILFFDKPTLVVKWPGHKYFSGMHNQYAPVNIVVYKIDRGGPDVFEVTKTCRFHPSGDSYHPDEDPHAVG